MASNPTSVAPMTDAALDEMVEPEPGSGRDKARLKEYGIPVWALIAALRRTDGDTDKVASAYRIPVVAVQAAIRYYDRNKPFIDAFLLLNSEANEF